MKNLSWNISNSLFIQWCFQLSIQSLPKEMPGTCSFKMKTDEGPVCSNLFINWNSFHYTQVEKLLGSQCMSSVALHTSNLKSTSCLTDYNMSLVTSDTAAVTRALSSFSVHSRAVHLVFYTAPNKKVQKCKINGTRGPYNWPYLS